MPRQDRGVEATLAAEFKSWQDRGRARSRSLTEGAIRCIMMRLRVQDGLRQYDELQTLK